MALWHAALVRSRRNVPGSYTFMWLLLAIAHWSLTSAVSLLVEDPETLIAIAKIQYLAIAPIGLLWVLFAARYARMDWPTRRWLQVLLIAEPVLTILLAVTNERHGLLWASIAPIDTPLGGSIVYTGGPWYWVHVAYTYALLLVGASMLVRGLRTFPPPYRRQRWAVVLGLLAPWIGNVLYLLRWPAPGIDLTPLGFAVSGLSLSWGVYRYRMFGLVPAARDMVVDSMEDGVLVLDSQRRMVDLNPAAEYLTGVTHAQTGRSIAELVPWWSSAGTEDRRSPTLPMIVRAEPSKYFEVRVLPLRDLDRPFVGWLVVVRDISARRRAEAERYAFERRMQEQQKAESLTVFAAGIAHDFNNLLTGILGNADLLAMQAPPDSPHRRTAEAIVIGAQRAADLVSKMLAYAGGGRVVAERVNLDTMAREMVELLSASVADHCTLTYDGPDSIPNVDADPTQVRQVVLNLIVNATEAVESGGVVTVATGVETLDREDLAKMTFGADQDPGNYVFVDVVDNGPGMSEDTLSRIFDPFFSTKDQGRGLGLAAVRGIVGSHQAALRVTTHPGQGTRFRVWLPLTPGKQWRPATR
jgi:PAS domain S-box-containing protein